MGKGRDKKKRRDKTPKTQKDSKKRRRNDSSDSEDLDAIVETFKRAATTEGSSKSTFEVVEKG